MMVNVGEKIFTSILNNEYLIKLYSKLLKNYTCFILDNKNKNDFSDMELIDLMRFADILSKSTKESRRDKHNNFAQSIISMLNSICPDNGLIKYFMGSILSNVNNYFGLEKNQVEYVNSDFIEFLKEINTKESYLMPNSTDSYFIGSQKLAYKRIKENDFYSFSAPTSMGKTFLIRTFIKEMILKGVHSNFVIVVPSKALINEISSKLFTDLREDLAKNNYKVIKTPASIQELSDCNYIMIYTQERLLHHLVKYKHINISYVFIDEAHKISTNDDRSALFYKALEILQNQSYSVKICFSCPNIPNPEVYLSILNNSSNMASNRFVYSPVNQHKIIIDCDSKKILNYNELDTSFQLIENFSLENLINCEQNNIDLINIIGKDKTNIVFCNSKKDAVSWAMDYASKLKDKESKEIEELINEIKESIHEDCFLVDTLRKGVAYHVAYIPTNIKESIEKLFKNGTIKTVFCTSTLLEGVNFPADNLFIMLNEKSDWLKDYNRANFKNLMGRVGRIEYNLFGNVIIISNNEVVDKYKSAIMDDIVPQELSIEALTLPRQKDIIKALLDGNTILKKRSTDSYDMFSFARKILSILLRDVLQDNTSYVVEYFSTLLDENTRNKIKANFINRDKQITDDLIVTCDQIESVDKEIKLHDLGYPTDVCYKTIYPFLLKIFKLYNWETYESKSDIGKENRLKYYATLMNKWMNGFGINQIITEAINYAADRGVIFVKNEGSITYDGTNLHKNIVINQVLDELDEVLQFKICNYLLKFSERLMFNKDLKVINNDWYEFMEFGTKNYIVIRLQKMGFSRDAANYIYRERLFYEETNEIFIDANKLTVKKFKKEIEEIKYNHPKNIK